MQFVRSFAACVQNFVRSLLRSFVPSFVRSVLQSIHSLVPIVRTFMGSFAPFVRSLTCSFARWFVTVRLFSFPGHAFQRSDFGFLFGTSAAGEAADILGHGYCAWRS